MSTFVFENYGFDDKTNEAIFRYNFNDERRFVESIKLDGTAGDYDKAVFENALFLAFLVIGTSYYKTFPAHDFRFDKGAIDDWQANFLNHVYQEGLGQFASENGLTRDSLLQFGGSSPESKTALPYAGEGIISLQSGGKDSLLTAALLKQKDIPFASLFVTSSDSYPGVLDALGMQVKIIRRTIDRPALVQAAQDGGLNGHIPVTYVVSAISLLQAIYSGQKTVLLSIGHEGEEPREWIGDLAVNHQWSKTWQAEELLRDYVANYVSPDIHIGSSLRRFSELRIAELFAEKAWGDYGHQFSSCNVANYMQGADNTALGWCGECPKCANSFLLFAPFVEPEELKSLFNGQDLFEKPLLTETFKGLLAIDDVPKPFECVGETDELRYAYASRKPGYAALPFDVPAASFDYKAEYPVQQWAGDLLTTV